MAKILALVLLFALSPALAEESCAVAGNCAEALDFDADGALGLLQTETGRHALKPAAKPVDKDLREAAGFSASAEPPESPLAPPAAAAISLLEAEDAQEAVLAKVSTGGHRDEATNTQASCSPGDCIRQNTDGLDIYDSNFLGTNRQRWKDNKCDTYWLMQPGGYLLKLQGKNYGKQLAPCDKATESICAEAENDKCDCVGTVWYGKKFVSGKPGAGHQTTLAKMKTGPTKSRVTSGSVSCSNDGMGGDPADGWYKWCYCAKAAR